MSRLELWGDSAVSEMPHTPQTVHEMLAVAAQELMAAATSGERHRYDVDYGCRIVEILAKAQVLLGAGGV